MVKCPNCGSTAQVKKVFSNYSTSIKAQCNSYKCSCGCLFSTRQYADGRTCGEWRVQEDKGCKMQREEVIDKIINTIEQCEGKEEDCENCAMSQFCLEYFCG